MTPTIKNPLDEFFNSTPQATATGVTTDLPDTSAILGRTLGTIIAGDDGDWRAMMDQLLEAVAETPVILDDIKTGDRMFTTTIYRDPIAGVDMNKMLGQRLVLQRVPGLPVPSIEVDVVAVNVERRMVTIEVPGGTPDIQTAMAIWRNWTLEALNLCTDLTPFGANPTLLSIDDYMDRQTTLMTALGIRPNAANEEYMNRPEFKGAIDGLVTEAAEVLDAVSVLTKPWKQVPLEDAREHLLEESLDVFFMLLEIWNLAGLTPIDVSDIYLGKLRRNYQRLAAARPAIVNA